MHKHANALRELYRSHGVGETVEHKFAFWESQHSGGYNISHNPTHEQAVAVFETSWLAEQFYGDFEHC